MKQRRERGGRRRWVWFGLGAASGWLGASAALGAALDRGKLRRTDPGESRSSATRSTAPRSAPGTNG